MKIVTKKVNNETWHYVIPYSIIEEFLCSHILTFIINHDDGNEYSDLGNKEIWNELLSKVDKLLSKLELFLWEKK